MSKIEKKPANSVREQNQFGAKFVILFLLIVGLVFWFWFESVGNKLTAPDGSVMKTELRDDSAERIQGLSGRESLGKDTAMLFAYDNEQDGLCFWMKDMKFDIDIIWLDSEKNIVDVKQFATAASFPEKFCPRKAAQYVIEVNSGQAAARGFVIGSRVKF